VRDSDNLDLVFEDVPRRGVNTGVVLSILLHALILFYLVKTYRAPSANAPAPPIARYVELIRQNPQFTEAPGAHVKTAPLHAPMSDANREAAMPHPTGDRPTTRPGDGGMYVPHNAPGAQAPSPAAPQQQASAPAQQQPQQQAQNIQLPDDANGRTFIYRPTQAHAAATGINWQGAIREMGKVASLGAGQESLDLGQNGGEKGFAKDGPISFESSWYDWGEYAESMVSRIRVNWYNNMPQIIRTGMRGVVFIRITIHRDGTITDVTILSSSGVPPYDFAAKKAIELSSPLNPLPKDFPNDTERVTFGFFYNQEPPNR
jgi:TonB family protein